MATNVNYTTRVFTLTRHTLLIGEIRQLIRGTGIEWVTLAIITVLQDNTEAMELLHEDLDYAGP